MKTLTARIGCALLCLLILSGCNLTRTVIPNHRVPHQISKKTKVRVWLRRPDGIKQEVTIEVGAGWWLMSPQLADQ